VGELIDAIQTFFGELAAVEWSAVGIALGLHFLRLLCRATAWREIIAAAYPDRDVPHGGIAGAYLAGTGVNAIVPARGGDVVKLVLAKRGIEGAGYTTLAPTLIVETLLDAVVAAGILIWAFAVGALPGINVLPDLPTIDWSWPLDHPRAALVVGLVWLVCIVALAVIWGRKVRDWKDQVRHGFAVLYEPRRYFTHVASWQAVAWVLRIASVWFFLEAFDIPATARNTMLVLAVQSLSTLLPFTPGGIGTQQGFLAYAFRGTGIPSTRVISFSVGMHIATNAFNAVVGLVALLVMARTLRWKQVVLPEKQKIERARAGK
jgi:uncharacterized membrane protein YbhN (UPF0104 family)